MTSFRFLSTGNDKPNNLPFLFLFISFLILGFLTFKDYGLSLDEPSQRVLNGLSNYDYITKGDYAALVNGNEKYHGPAFEIALVFAEKILNVKDSGNVYHLRHLLTFLTFALGVLFFYLVCLQFLKSEISGLIGCAFLILSPRIFAESFYNSKDVAFLSFMIMNIYTALLFDKRKTVTVLFFHAIVTALVIDIRVTGIIIPAISMLLLIPDLFINHGTGKIKTLLSGGAYLILTIGFVILFWPVLWRNPVHHFVSAVSEMSHYHWKGYVLYRGNFISAENLPWHYIPAWLFITTPVLYTVLFFSGIVVFFRSILKKGLMTLIRSKFMIINLSVFFLPLLAVIFLHSVVYDSWRHLYFIYPSFLLIGLWGLQTIFEWVSGRRIARLIVYGFLFFSLISTTIAMMRLHPYQNVYFNSFAGKDMEVIKQNFEMDYWGLSFKEGLDYILDHDTASVVKIYPDNYSGQVNSYILSKERRDRIVFTESVDEATYFITNFRWHPEKFGTEEEYYSVNAGNTSILGVYKVTPLFRSFFKTTTWHY